MADEVPTKVRSMVERALEADVTDQLARRGRELAGVVVDATETVSARVADGWRDSAPQRREAEKAARRAGHDAMRWSRRTWKKELRPTLDRLWGRRTAVISAAGAAIPVGRELAEDAATRVGLRQRRERRHWTAFFLGLLIGAAAGAVVAMLTTPKPGRQMRNDLAERARHAADGASEWVPLFQHASANGDRIATSAASAPAEPPLAAPEAGAPEGAASGPEPAAAGFEEPASEGTFPEGEEGR